MRIYIILIFLLCSCTDLLINKTEYHSIQLKGNAWVQINQGTNFNANNFTLQSWFSGSDTIINGTQTIISMLNSSGEILIGIFKDPTYEKRLNIWINNEEVNTIEVTDELSNIDSFNLITLVGGISDLDPSFISISIFVNGKNILSQHTTLTTDALSNIDFIIGAKANTGHNYLDSFWHGCIDEIRLWNIALSDSIIQYHNNYPYKLSFEADSLAYINQLGHLSGLWRFYTTDNAYSTVPNDACSSIERLYNDNPCTSDSEATIYTYGIYSKVEFSEKHK